MLDSLSSEARQVYACLELGTMGFQQELAVTMESGGKKRPLTPGDIAKQTELSNQNVRRGLVELESAGLAERRSDDGRDLRHGHVVIYSWAVPRKASPARGSSRARLLFPDWFPTAWEPLKPLIKRRRLSVFVDEVVARDYFKEGEQVARDQQKAEEVVTRFLQKVCARAKKRSPNKEERTERKVSPASSSFPATIAAVSAIATADDDAVRQLVKKCRKERADASDEEIAHFVREKAKQASRADNPMGLLLTAVPKCFEGEVFTQYRAKSAQQAKPQEPRERSIEERIATVRGLIALSDTHPQLSEWRTELAELERLDVASKPKTRGAAG
jgi:hypothetical protein